MSFFKRQEINNSNFRGDNPMDLLEFLTKLRNEGHLRRRIKEYHRDWNTPIKATIGEELWTKIFNQDFGFGETHDDKIFGWVPESHKIGADMTVSSLKTKRISIKTGKITKIGKRKASTDIKEDHRIVYSSHRMTKYGELSEAIGFLSIPHSDVTFCLSPNIKYGKYYLVVMENLDYSRMNWVERYSKETKKHTGWTGQDDEQGVIKTHISKSMSSQLWIEMKLSSNRIIYMEEICD